MIGSKILGSGVYLPKRIVTNKELAEKLNVDEEWIYKVTGIERRRYASENETLEYMAEMALKNAIVNSNIRAKDIDYVIVFSDSRTRNFPGIVGHIQNKLKIPEMAGIDMEAGCTAPIFAMQLADSLITSGKYNTVALVGVESLSKLIENNDKNTAILFGDGASAVIMGKSLEAGYINGYLRVEGKKADVLVQNEKDSFMYMNGMQVYKFGVNSAAEAYKKVVKGINFDVNKIDHVISHQSNERMIKAIAKKISIDPEKVFSILKDYGNTGAASTFMAFHIAREKGVIKKDQHVVFTAYGAGLAYGAIIFRLV
jgi:3-oxoacyl-[acyl-carrier-protein] synthase-3